MRNLTGWRGGVSLTLVLLNSAFISASETEKWLNYPNMTLLTLLYIDFKYHILFLTNLFINIKEIERKGVYKISPHPHLMVQMWTNKFGYVVYFYQLTTILQLTLILKIEIWTHKKLAQGYSKTTPKNRMSLKTCYFEKETRSRFYCSLVLLRNHLLFSIWNCS